MGISTHILDTATGRPAAAVPVTLARFDDGAWLPLATSQTDPDGRCKSLFPSTQPLTPGIYRIHFATNVYYQQQQLHGLYPFIEITFTVPPHPHPSEQHFHIPLLLTANGYTTYRGS